MTPARQPSRRGLAVAAALAGAGLVAGCGSAVTTTTTAPVPAVVPTADRTPVTVLSLTTLSGPETYPEVPAGVRAAAARVNDNGGVAGHPLRVVTCDDHATAAGAVACAHEAVADRAVAVVGAETAFGDAYVPVLAAAGIPSVADDTRSSAELTSPLSFPIGSSALTLAGAQCVLAADGATDVASSQAGIAVPGLPDAVRRVAARCGGGTTGAAPAGEVGLVTRPRLTTVLRTANRPVAVTGATLTAAAFPASAAPTYLVTTGWPTTDPGNAGIAAYRADLAAVGAAALPTDDAGLEAWTGTQVIALLLQRDPGDLSAAALVSAMRSAGPVSRPEWPTFDWSHPALTGLPYPRIFTTGVMVAVVRHGVATPAAADFVTTTNPLHLTQLIR